MRMGKNCKRQKSELLQRRQSRRQRKRDNVRPLQVLTETRDLLENAQAEGSVKVPDLNMASTAVIQLRATLKCWEAVKKVWTPSEGKTA